MKAFKRLALYPAWARYLTIATVCLVAAVVFLTIRHQPRVRAGAGAPPVGLLQGPLTFLENTYFTSNDTSVLLAPGAITQEDPPTVVNCPSHHGCILQVSESVTLNGQGFGAGNGISLNVYIPDLNIVAPTVFSETLNDACGGNGCTASGQRAIPIPYGKHTVYTLIDTQDGAYIEYYENIYQLYISSEPLV